jgi:hypothetical protein
MKLISICILAMPQPDLSVNSYLNRLERNTKLTKDGCDHMCSLITKLDLNPLQKKV